MRRTSSIAVAHLGRRQPGHRLVEQQHLGLGRERAGDLQPLAAGRAEAARRRVDRRGRGRRAAARRAPWPRASRGVGMAQQRADHGVVEHRHRFEGERHLEGAREPEPRARLGRQARDVVAGEGDACPRSTGRSPVRQLKKVDLPAPLGPIRPRISPSSTDDRGVVDRLEGAERLDDVARLNQHGARPCGVRRSADSAAAARQEAGDDHDDRAIDHEGEAGALAAEIGCWRAPRAAPGSARRPAGRTAGPRRRAPP